MKILFLGGDKRQKQMIRDLYEKGHNINLLGFENLDTDNKLKKVTLNNLNISKYDVIIFPVGGVNKNFMIKAYYHNNDIKIDPNILKDTKEDVLIFTGVKTPFLKTIEDISKRNIIPLMNEKDVVIPNAIVTCEGIVKDLIDCSDVTIYGSNIMVIGYGNVGKRLVELLHNMGAKVKVAVKEKEDYFALSKLGIKSFYSKDIKHYLEHSNIIVNTAPSLVLSKDELKLVNKDTYLLDVASLPGGIDLDSANELGLKNKHLLGIPGYTAPITAGRILSKKINEYIGR
ncbi:MAG: dipicolinate synthase subunit DpsA [Bacilli bacterium]